MSMITLVKALGIIAIVAGHVGPVRLATLVYLYHIPLFFFVSGYLFTDKHSHAIWGLIKKRLMTLYFPYLIYCIIFLVLRDVFIRVGFYSQNPQALIVMPTQASELTQGTLLKIFSFQYFEPLLWTFWFLPVLFFTAIFFACIRRIALMTRYADSYTAIMVVILAIIGFLGAHLGIQTELRIDCSFVALIFFFAGFLFRKHENAIPLKACWAIPAFIGMFAFGRHEPINMLHRLFGNPVVYVSCALAGIYFNFWLAAQLAAHQGKAVGFLQMIGRNTFSILALHLTSFKLVLYVRIMMGDADMLKLVTIFPATGFEMSFQWYVIYTAVGVLVPVVLAQALHIIKGRVFNVKDHLLEASSSK